MTLRYLNWDTVLNSSPPPIYTSDLSFSKSHTNHLPVIGTEPVFFLVPL